MDNGEKTEKKRAVSPINGQPVPNGRTKGVPNKKTQAVRDAIATFIQNESQHLNKWADEIYNKKGAEGALEVFMGLLEYAQPKLARVESQNLDKDGNPADATSKIEVVLVNRKD